MGPRPFVKAGFPLRERFIKELWPSLKSASFPCCTRTGYSLSCRRSCRRALLGCAVRRSSADFCRSPFGKAGSTVPPSSFRSQVGLACPVARTFSQESFHSFRRASSFCAFKESTGSLRTLRRAPFTRAAAFRGPASFWSIPARACAIPRPSDAEGRFAFELLPPGDYSARATAQGMAPQVTPQLHVDVGGATEIEFRLTLAGPQENVTVSSSPTLVESQASAVSALLDERAIGEFPLNGPTILGPGTIFTRSDPGSP